MYSKQQGAAAQFPTLSCTIPAVCIATAIAGCNSAQAQTIYPTMPGMCGVLPPSIGCNAGAQAQTILTAPPHCGGIYTNAVGCSTITGAAQTAILTAGPHCGGVYTNAVGCSTITGAAQTAILTAPPHCGGIYTNAVGCSPANYFTQVPGVCGVYPPSIGCPPKAGAQVGPTGTQGCTATATAQPTHVSPCVGPTGTQGCTVPPNAGAQNVGPTGWLTCGVVGRTGTQGCTSTVSTIVQPTHVSPCVGPTGTEHCLSTIVGPTGTQGCTQASTVTTTVQPTHASPCYGPTGTQGCTVPPNAGAQNVGHTGWYTCGVGAAQAVPPVGGYAVPMRTDRGCPSLMCPTNLIQCKSVACHSFWCLDDTQGQTVATSALGCPSTSTCPPNVGAVVQSPSQHVTGCNHACTMTCPAPGAQAQAFPTISLVPEACMVTAIAGCGGVTGIPIVC